MAEMGAVVGMIEAFTSGVEAEMAGKLEAPSTAGTSGQVLVSDGNGGQVWGDIDAGEVVIDSTLSVAGAAADAKACGDLKTAVDDVPVEAGSGVGSLQSKQYTSGNTSFTQNASGNGAIALGANTTASGSFSFAEGRNTVASGSYSHAEGYYVYAYKGASHAEGRDNASVGTVAHTEGKNNYGVGEGSHTEGDSNCCYGKYSHVEGSGYIGQIRLTGAENVVTYNYSQLAGTISPNCIIRYKDIAAKVVSIDDVNLTITLNKTLSGTEAINTLSYFYIVGAYGNYSHVEGLCCVAESNYQHVRGKFNIVDKDNVYEEIIGNGTSVINLSNARTLDWSGNERLMGDVYVGCDADSTGGTKLARIPDPPTTDGVYTLQATVSDGTITYTWVSEST